MKNNEGYLTKGIASWYGSKFHGRKTSSGEIYDAYGMTAAHKTLPLPTYVRVTNLENYRSVIVKVNDRGPFAHNRLIDLSYAAAKKLGITKNGTGLVEVRAINTKKTKTYTSAKIKTPTTVPKPGLDDSKAGHTTASSNTDEKLYIQVAAFQDQQNAKSLRNRLEQLSVSEISIHEGIQNQKTIYRVRIGPVANMKLAGELTDMLNQRGLNGSRIIID